MKRFANIIAGLSLAVLFFAVSAHAQLDGPRVTATIPFEFTVGDTAFSAGQYEFTRLEGNVFRIHELNGRSSFTLSTASVQFTGSSEKSAVIFETVNGHHVLIQISNERAAINNQFPNGHSSAELTTR